MSPLCYTFRFPNVQGEARVKYQIDHLHQSDWQQMREIYLEGIAMGQATFETEAPTWEQWDSSHVPFGRVVARAGGAILGWGALSLVSRRSCYAGVAEASVYVAVESRGRGVGGALLEAVIRESESKGIWTLQAAIFPENVASLSLVKKHGFREVGRRERLGRLDGDWRDVLLLERRSTLVGV